MTSVNEMDTVAKNVLTELTEVTTLKKAYFYDREILLPTANITTASITLNMTLDISDSL